MDKEEKEFLEKLQRDVDYRFQKIKELNYDLQSKIIELQKVNHAAIREVTFWYHFVIFWKRIFRRNK